jgi:hypothetical protein
MASNHIPAGARVVDIEMWRRYHYAGTASDGQTPEARKKAFQRVRQRLQAAGVVGIHTDLIWIIAGIGTGTSHRDTLIECVPSRPG